MTQLRSKVLLIDDDVSVATSLQEVLEVEGFCSEAIFDANVGLMRAQSDDFDVVVTDLLTYYGKLSYTLHQEGPDTLRLIITGDLALPPGKIVVKPPLPRPLVQVEVNGSMIETFDAQSASCAECPAEMIMKY